MVDLTWASRPRGQVACTVKLWLAARPASDRRHLRGGARAWPLTYSFHCQAPARVERRQICLASRARGSAEESGARRSRAARSHARAGLLGPRTRWQYIAAAKDAVEDPEDGNGDIRTPEDAVAMAPRTGCDAADDLAGPAPANPGDLPPDRAVHRDGPRPRPERTGDWYRMIRTYFTKPLEEGHRQHRGVGREEPRSGKRLPRGCRQQ